MWRTLGNQTYPSPDPSVYVIKAKLPAVVAGVVAKEQMLRFADIFQQTQHTSSFEIYGFFE